MPWQCRKCIEALADRCQARVGMYLLDEDSCAGVPHNDCLFQDFKGRRWEVCWASMLWEACINLCTYKTRVTLFHEFHIIQHSRHLQVYILSLPIFYNTSHLQPLFTFHSSR